MLTRLLYIVLLLWGLSIAAQADSDPTQAKANTRNGVVVVKPNVAPQPQIAPGEPDDPNAITLRGTVVMIDTRHTAFVVKVKDHTRTVLLADDTDLSGLGKIPLQAFPVKIGDRVTVAGELQPNSTVLAAAITYSRSVPNRVTIVLPHDHVLVGRVSSTSNRYSSRDIKIRLADDREIKIKVPHGITIQRDGQPISVHDLHHDESVRVTGGYDGGAFQATRIEVVSPVVNLSPGGFSRL